MGLTPFQILLRNSTAIVCCLWCVGLHGQSHDSRDLSAQVDEVVRAQMHEQHIPGVSLAVMRGGKVRVTLTPSLRHNSSCKNASF
jgi:low affinity Fe/Cu permease